MTRTSPTIRPDLSSRSPERYTDRHDTRDTRGLYRKDYENLGQIWRERRERRDTYSDKYDRDKRSSTSWHIGVNFNYFPGSYRYYRYDYIPGRVYPSAYCYYYGLYPPYVDGLRVVYVRHDPFVRYVYVDLPIYISTSRPSYHYGHDYYLTDRHRNLSDALRDIERAWERSDLDLLMDHVRSGSRVDVFLDKDYAYSVDHQDYYEMTRDAMRAIRTSSFDLYRVRERNGSEIVAYGKHVYYDDYDSHRNTVYVSYTLERRGSDWYIIEVGSSRDKLD